MEALTRDLANLEAARSLVQRVPGTESQATLARMLCGIGFQFLESGKNNDATAPLAEGVELVEKLLEREPDRLAHRELQFDLCTNLGTAYMNVGRWAAMETAHRRASDVQRGLAGDFPHVPRHIDALNTARMGVALALDRIPGREQDSVALFREAVASQDALVTSNATVLSYRATLALLLGNFGDRLVRHDAQEAVSILEHAAREHAAVRVEDSGNPTYALRQQMHLFALLTACRELKDSRRAADAVEEALRVSEKGLVDYRRAAGRMAAVLNVVPSDPALSAQERRAEALAHVQRALDLLELAIAAGYADAKDFEGFPDFEVLRAETRWQEFAIKVRRGG